MATGGTTVVIPFLIPAGADPTTAAAAFEIFSAGGTTDVNVQVLAPNGVAVPGGTGVVPAVTYGTPGNTNALFRNLFTLTTSGTITFTAVGVVNIQVAMQLIARTPTQNIRAVFNCPSQSAAAGTVFGVWTQTNTSQVAVANPSPVTLQIGPLGGAVTNVAPNNTAFINVAGAATLVVSGGPPAIVTYGGEFITAMG